MKNKGIISLMVMIIFILGALIIYGYNTVPDAVDQNIFDNNISESVIDGPRIEAIPNSYDLGTVIYGEISERIFIIKNLGNKTLEILRLTTSCGCTTATIAEEDKVIAPGQSVDMLVTFNPAIHKDDTDLGDLTRIIYIKTNDSKNPEIEVEINANVIKNN